MLSDGECVCVFGGVCGECVCWGVFECVWGVFECVLGVCVCLGVCLCVFWGSVCVFGGECVWVCLGEYVCV